MLNSILDNEVKIDGFVILEATRAISLSPILSLQKGDKICYDGKSAHIYMNKNMIITNLIAIEYSWRRGWLKLYQPREYSFIKRWFDKVKNNVVNKLKDV